MATNQPQNLSEWQLHCVLKRASLIQYYASFIKNGEVDVIKLAESDDIVFKDIMEKVGMAKKLLHVRQFRNTLLEWTKDPGKNEHVPSYIQTADDAKCATAVLSLKSTAVSGSNSRLPQIQNDDDEKWKKQNEHCTIFKSEKTGIQPKQHTKSNQTQRVVKDQKLHALFPYYDELTNKTVLDKMVLDNLISRCILMIEDREEIIKPTTQRERNRVLLDILTERPYGTKEGLKDVLQESDPLNSDVQEIFSKMQCTEKNVEQISCHDILIHEHVIKLQKNYLMFVNDMDCKSDILDHLYETGVLDTEEKEEVYNYSITRHESNRLLLSKLVRKGEDAYGKLLEALRQGQYYEIASNIEKTAVSELEIQWCQIGIKQLRDRERKKDVRVTYIQKEELTHDEHDEVIPKHILDQFERRLNQWKVDDEHFVNITAEKKVMEHILTESTVTIVGNSGTGKSFLSRHVALAMMKRDYIIIPCDNPGDIRQWCKPGRKTLFVFDDVCGRYILNQQIYNDWKQRLDHITSLLKDKCCKIMVTCRLDVFKNEQFGKLSIFKTCSIDLSSEEFKLNAAEKLDLAQVYFKEKANKVTELSEKYEFFPLLCSLYYKQQSQKHVNIGDFFSNPFGIFQNELDDWYSEGKAGKVKYCCLALCVMFNNTLSEENFNTKDSKIGTVLEDLFEECELNKGTPLKSLQKSLETFEGTYVVKEGSTYKIIHDKLFDFLASYFGKKMLQLFIEHANADFIKERFLWKAADNIDTDIDFTIGIPNNFINTYIDRLIKDWKNGFVTNVFSNINMDSRKFSEKFISSVNNLDQPKQDELASTEDIKVKITALETTCFCSVGNLVNWLISIKSDINHCGEDGISPLICACVNEDVDVVKELIQHSADVNKCTDDGDSPLNVASQEGHVDVVKALLLHSADVNKCNNNDESPLFTASQEGHVDVVKQLVEHSADVNKLDNDGDSPLYTASHNAHVDVVKELIKHSADVNQCNNDGISPLCMASQEGHVDVVKELIEHSADVNKCTDDGDSPLNVASQEGHVDVVKALLLHSADVNKCDNNDESPLFTASQEGHVGVVKELIQHSADVNKCTNDGGSSLYIASKGGHVDVVKELILHSANVNKCCHDGDSPLSIASYFNNTEVVKIILQCDEVDINLCDEDGRTPLYWASFKGHVDVVKELLQYAAVINQCDKDGKSPLFTASQEGHVDVVKALLLHSADVNKCNNNDASPLYTASQGGHVDVVKELILHSANVNKCCHDTEVVKIILQCDEVDINLCDEDGRTPLYWASLKGHVDVVKELLQYAAVINQCDKDGKSPLFTASQEGHVDVVKALLLHSADVNKCNNNDESPLFTASQEGHVDVVKQLVEHSADVNKLDNEGDSPLYTASHNGHVDVVKELIKHSADVNQCNNDGILPLCMASQKGHVDVVKELLQHSADVNKCKSTV